MTRCVTYAAAVLVALSTSVAIAQKVTTVEELDKTMKRVGPAQQGLNKAIQSMAYADARKNIPVIRQALLDAENFWVTKKKADAIKSTKEAVARLDALDKVLASSPDAGTATAAFKELGGACRSCHMTYREQVGDDFRLKPGTVE
jgi:cytochrome c556